MKSEVPRPCASLDKDRRWLVGNQGSARRIELINKDFIQAKITAESKPVRRIGACEMRMRTGLTLRVDAGAVMLDYGGCRPQDSIRMDWKRGNCAISVICDQETFPSCIH